MRAQLSRCVQRESPVANKASVIICNAAYCHEQTQMKFVKFVNFTLLLSITRANLAFAAGSLECSLVIVVDVVCFLRGRRVMVAVATEIQLDFFLLRFADSLSGAVVMVGEHVLVEEHDLVTTEFFEAVCRTSEMNETHWRAIALFRHIEEHAHDTSVFDWVEFHFLHESTEPSGIDDRVSGSDGLGVVGLDTRRQLGLNLDVVILFKLLDKSRVDALERIGTHC